MLPHTGSVPVNKKSYMNDYTLRGSITKCHGGDRREGNTATGYRKVRTGSVEEMIQRVRTWSVKETRAGSVEQTEDRFSSGKRGLGSTKERGSVSYNHSWELLNQNLTALFKP